jgi:soluble lytic murein transglycosylase-like protein
LPKERKLRAPMEKSRRQKVETIIESEAKKQGVEPALIKAVIHVESNFDAGAISYAGAQGLMQLMPDTVAYLRLNDPFDPEENIEGGTRHLRYLLRRFNGDLSLTLAAYHAGAETVQRHGKIPPIQQTRSYVEKVLRLYQKYSGTSVRNRLIYEGERSNGAVLYTNHPERYPQVIFQKFKE